MAKGNGSNGGSKGGNGQSSGSKGGSGPAPSTGSHGGN